MTSERWRRRFRIGRIGSAALILLCMASVAQAKGRNPMKIPGAQYEPVTWAAIEGWADDEFADRKVERVIAAAVLQEGMTRKEFFARLNALAQEETTFNRSDPGGRTTAR